ncbi:bifunctional 3,4-dihydroxy-2-butanone-4-phosphate synthase/GTP cyclohydrolase II [Prochlorococcus marinus]|uniref:Riboflavin biosynthesis protein RibBA n=1 Tax=Prochlorococcus marinus XMU1408 TaxID=2213228 RepID=A0A318RH71_PROMR|nr:bifunctional 3,4-dihydroxy-2-butanone-4-phosphate synthase/GTP cyclohydrolase II [Prochlorococcus marinus]MBW3041946.1 bifunctional 3,4-dihydroxy-2-butanone-4-phosphate synthase/GTP cyclohydrolase II [Prochlorococcus marinus str. XMU1408]PYE03073.1 bifunctional 3,4-dihydroxy-2-butanone-4-phosphate synthase/GTP cyclohydrolase II [Prochlorococcus marinus XMU1408]
MKSEDCYEIEFDDIADALAAIRNGECVVVVDDEKRENEGDLICAAQFATPQQINFMATEARGLICLAMQGERLDQLDLPLMVDRNTDSNQTAFTVSIDAGPEFGVSTGISAEDRAKTIQVALNSQTRPIDLRRPGHIFPLRAKIGGVLKRAGHTEAAVDLSLLAGLSPAGVICEIQNQDGSMARLPELKTYAKERNLKLISIADLIHYRLENERFVYRQAIAKLPSLFGDFKAIGYKNELDGSEHVAIIKGDPEKLKEPVLVRMHSECLTGDAFGSLRCDCRPQLEAALSRISEEGEGVVVYLRQEGRGIGLVNKLKAYNLQDGGLDTVEANEKLGFPADLRNYGVGAQILTDLGINRLKLLTNNPRKIAGLGGYGLQVESRVPLVICPGDHNAAYLEVKREKLGHLIGNNIQNNLTNERQNIVVYWDGKVHDNELKHFENKANKWSENHFLNISIQNAPRLIALCENPLFIWNVRHRDIKTHLEGNLIDKRLLESLLKELSNWKNTERVGIIKTDNYEQLLHPSQNILIEEKEISELSNFENSPLFDWDLKDKTSTIEWS